MMMRLFIFVLFTYVSLLLASPAVFSVYDDLLAYPQYEIYFSESLVSNSESAFLISQKSPASQVISGLTRLTSISSQQGVENEKSPPRYPTPSDKTYEILHLQGVPHLCSIPIIAKSQLNETFERESRSLERQELARATERAWELLQGLDGSCLYFISGWWSYSFCFNAEVTQFHHLTLQPGKQDSPKRDPNTKPFVLGKATSKEGSRDSSNSKLNGLTDLHRTTQMPRLELNSKGGTRYLVQRMESGTICDLTNKPRRIEIQFHCNPSMTDRIGYIKEVTTCSYLMVVYTPRLCSEVIFLPPKENKTYNITCRMVVEDNELLTQDELNNFEKVVDIDLQDISSKTTKDAETPKNIGGILVGAGRWINSEAQRISIPEIFSNEVQDYKDQAVEIIARAMSKAEGGQVEVASDADLKKLDLDPDMVEALRIEVQKMAKEKGWKIEIVDTPGQTREILGIVDGENEADTEKKDKEGQIKDEL
ncbi:putative misfolded glycoproteins degradation protein yos9 [Erysiphe necator]|uniref:Endoplasmic reticulum lectin n=1 Tax=Uncinula necator TaxID=52586 RepID=A0A0B1NYQ8_UNCNE|nr:putative misfolded glycoproteins degradation protein yos9 [Erysiphe necator]